MDQYLLRTSSTESLPNKRPAEDVIWRKPKRTITNRKRLPTQGSTTTFNRFGGLPDDNDCSDGETLHDMSKLKHKKSNRSPPIILEAKEDWSHKTITNLVSRFVKDFHLHYWSSGAVAIHCYSNESHKLLNDGLRSENILFHTFGRKDERKYKVVIRGVPSEVIDSVSSELAKLGFNDATVTKLKGSSMVLQTSCSALLVQLPAGTDIAKFRRINYLCNCAIQIERFKPNNSFGTQCYRCQRFGHSSRNCNLTERCVKCIGNHATKDCPKKERSSPAQCCNCKENHPANFRQCSSRLEYLQRLQQKTLKLQKPKGQSAPVLVKPTLKPQQSKRSYANVASSEKLTEAHKQNDASDTDETTATSEMLQILNILKTIKDQFRTCTTMLDKVTLVLTYLGQYV